MNTKIKEKEKEKGYANTDSKLNPTGLNEKELRDKIIAQ